MTSRWPFQLTIVAAVVTGLLASCAATASEVRRANEARYPESAFDEVFRSAREAIVAKGYTIGREDPARGLLVSNVIFVRYQDDKYQQVRKRLVPYLVAVELRSRGDGSFSVVVDGNSPGESRDAADRPAFMDGRRDALAAEIFRRIGHLAIKGPSSASDPT